MTYQPNEDSELLARQVRKLARGRVLDMGTGSGIQAVVAASRKSVSSVLAVDADPEAIRHCRAAIRNNRIRFLQSDLFSKIKGRTFDTIIFNPPYLPQETAERDIELEGGKHGYETILRFLHSAASHISTNGQMLLLFSSLSKKQKIEQAIKQALLDYRELDRLHISFEDLYVYRITKSALLKRIENAGMKRIEYRTRGKRSWIHKGTYRGKICAIKTKRPDAASDPVPKEAKALKTANRLDIGPKLLLAGQGFVAYEWIDGRYLQDVLEKADTRLKRALFRQLFQQAFAIDKAGLAKEEMQRPLKNAIVTQKGKVVLIDFERLHRTKKPKNTTQLCSFAAKQGIAQIEKIQRLASEYKQKPSKTSFARLIRGMNL